jgi:prevent-host-death family protein
MTNVVDYTATEARANLFEILNSVYFGETEVRIIKNKKPMVRITKEVSNLKKNKDPFELCGLLSVNEAKNMEKEIEKLKNLPGRNNE